jgi:hypothetical protein
MRKRKKSDVANLSRGPGQPRIDPDGVLERRSVGLPPAWWREIDRLTEHRGLKASVVVRAAVGLYLRRVGKIEIKLKRKDKTGRNVYGR